jgi:hypothetical protein
MPWGDMSKCQEAQTGRGVLCYLQGLDLVVVDDDLVHQRRPMHRAAHSNEILVHRKLRAVVLKVVPAPQQGLGLHAVLDALRVYRLYVGPLPALQPTGSGAPGGWKAARKWWPLCQQMPSVTAHLFGWYA